MNALALASPPAWKCPTPLVGLLPGGMTEKVPVKSSAVSPVRSPVRSNSNVTGPIATEAGATVSASAFAMPPFTPMGLASSTLYAPKPSAPFGLGFVIKSASKVKTKAGSSPPLDV